MKNKIFFVEMAILILSLGLVFVGCKNDDGGSKSGGGGSGSTLKIINEHTSATITKVTVIYAGSNGEREPDTFTTNTAPGQTWEQFISFSGYGMAIGVEIEVSGATIENYYRGTTASLSPGETKTLKLTDADGLR